MLLFITLAAVAAQAAAPTSTPIPADPDQKVRCQREEVTGSLVGSRKVCHTVAEWRRMSDDAQAAAGKMIEQGAICPSCQGR